MESYNKTKLDQLGMPIGTASARLRKAIIFNFLKRLNENFCFQCGLEIENIDELSIEHKVPYLHSENPKELFFDLDNVAFSHLVCNVGAARRLAAGKIAHPSTQAYSRGCRCRDCTTLHGKRIANYRKRIRESAGTVDNSVLETEAK